MITGSCWIVDVLHGSSGGGSRASSCSPRSGGLLESRGTGSHHLSSCVSVRWSPSGPFGRGHPEMAGFYSSAARSSDLTQAAAFPVSDPTRGRRTCKGWPTPAISAKISRSSHGPEKGPGKWVGPATASVADSQTAVHHSAGAAPQFFRNDRGGGEGSEPDPPPFRARCAAGQTTRTGSSCVSSGMCDVESTPPISPHTVMAMCSSSLCIPHQCAP